MKFPGICLLAFSVIGISSQKANALLEEIPVALKNIDGLGPSIITYVSILGGSSNVPVLVDTGSSQISLCKTVEIGNSAIPDDLYGCDAYGSGSPNGVIGQLYNTSITFGDGQEKVTDPKDVVLVLQTAENTDLCFPELKGILGVDANTNRVYDEPQVLPSPDSCSYTSENRCCAKGNSHEQPSQFVETMLGQDDLHTFAFIGLSLGVYHGNSPTSNTPVIAFGETARKKVESSVSAGTASFTSSKSSWYTFADETTFAVTGFNDNDCIQMFGNTECSVSASTVLIDSGTQELQLPMNKPMNELTGDTSSAVLTITVGDVELELDYKTMMKIYGGGGIQWLGAPAPGKDSDMVILGFPIFLFYDILFDVSMEKLDSEASRYGNVTFYKHPDVPSAEWSNTIDELKDDVYDLESAELSEINDELNELHEKLKKLRYFDRKM